MEERGYVAEALLERLRADGIAFRLLTDSQAFPDHAPEECELAVPASALPAIPKAAARFAQDFDLRLVELYRPGRAAWRAVFAWTDDVGRPRFLSARFFVAAEEGMTSAALFVCTLIEAVERRALPDERARWLAALWRVDPQDPAEGRAGGDGGGARAEQPLSAMVGQVERAILRWLECRVERPYPDAVVGPNPLAARLLQVPLIGRAVGWFLGCRLNCRIRSPILMPLPLGIVIERGVELGSRVTVMHQVTIGRKDPVAPREQGGTLAVIEDNVFIGAGAKVLGPVRIGRGATVGANEIGRASCRERV